MLHSLAPPSRLGLLAALATLTFGPQQAKPGTKPGTKPPVSWKAADDADFGRLLDVVRKLEDSGKWSAASTALENLLADTGDASFVHGRRPEILVELKRIAVRIAVPQPDPATLIHGKLLAWDKKSGDLSLLYEPVSTDDFEKHGDAWLLPPDFDGPVTIHVEGDAFDFAGSDLCQFFVGCRGDDSTAIAIGAERTIGNTKYDGIVKILRRRGTRDDTLFDGDKAPPYGKRFELDVAIGADDITVTCNHTRLAQAKRPPDLGGAVGFVSHRHVTRMSIRGRASTAWLQAKIDAATHDAEEKFLATWNADDHLPKWLASSEAPKLVPTASRHLPPEKLPWRMVPPHVKFVNDIYALLDAGKLREAVDRIRKLKTAEMPEDVRVYVSLVVLDSVELLPAYVEWVDRFLKKHPDFEFAHRMRAHCLLQEGKLEEAAQELAAMEGHCEDEAGVAAELVETLLDLERVDDAAQVLRTAEAAGATSPRLVGLQQLVLNVRRGPGFAKRFDQKSDHFALATDMDSKTPALAVKQLEESYRICVQLFGEPADPKRALPVYLFAGQTSYDSYAGSFAATAHSTAGMYSPMFKQLIAWNLPEREETMRTLRHEATHQFLDRLGVRAPIWVNEGFACYVQMIASSSKSDLKAGAVDRDLLRRWKVGREHAFKIDLLLNARHEEFYGNPSAAYPEAWGLVHYLRHAPLPEGSAPERAPQAIGARLLKALRDHVAIEEVNERTFKDVNLDALEENLLNYLDALCASEGIR